MVLQGGQDDGSVCLALALSVQMHIPCLGLPHPETSSFIPSYTQLGLGEAMTGRPGGRWRWGTEVFSPSPQTRQICPL